MEITNENFLAKLPEICETIQDCDFIAIDTELSGLMREKSLNRFDLPEERFCKALESSRGYFIMQFGLSCFTRIGDLRYSCRTYNVYIFPQPHKCYGDIDRTFAIQAHAIQFLTEHNFDFNKLFKYGVSYLTFEEKKLLTAQLKQESRNRSKVEFNKDGVPKFVPISMMTFFRESIKRVNKFVAKVKREKDAIETTDCKMSTCSDGIHESEIHTDGDAVDGLTEGPTMEIRDCGTHHRRSMLKRALECLPIADNIFVDARNDPKTNETYLMVEYTDKETKSERQKKALLTAKGFLEVIETIILNKKPLVGHNLSLDLVQIINQFIEQLSDDYNSFKETCHSLFPLIYDTKFIAHSILDPKTLTHNQSRLNDLYCQLRLAKSFPKIQIEHLGPFYDENQLPHQAGYDAYMSGFSFLVLCEAYMRAKKKKRKNNVEDNSPPKPIAQQSDIIEEFANKIHLSYSYDFKCFYLSGEEYEPDRGHVFYVEFPGNWGLDDLFQLFGQLGGVEASKLNKTSALCALRDPKQVQATLQKAKKLKEANANHRIYSYGAYIENFKSKRLKDIRVQRENSDDDVDVSDA